MINEPAGSASSENRLWLLGDPVEHSVSPIFQNAALSACGIPWVYETRRVDPAMLRAAFESIRCGQAKGANITLPYKQVALTMVDETHDSAAHTGAVNTVVAHQGRLVGYNTDVGGLLTDLQQWLGARQPVSAQILGAGGAARAAVRALDLLGVQVVTVHNRSEPATRALVSQLKTRCTLSAGLQTADLTVHATSFGVGSAPCSERFRAAYAAWSQIPMSRWAYDLNYAAGTTPFLEAARHSGAESTRDGRGMLLHQGAEAFCLWTGRAAPVDTMASALTRAMC